MNKMINNNGIANKSSGRNSVNTSLQSFDSQKGQTSGHARGESPFASLKSDSEERCQEVTGGNSSEDFRSKAAKNGTP